MKTDASPMDRRLRKCRAGSVRINTTLYDLVEAVMEEVGTRESSLVTFVVLHLLGKKSPFKTSLVYH
ncbi:MAG: hypothetical protein PHS17_14465 [Desulfobacterales bacterium]|nr:hypothetical protein [Desulfobacterales bacterium]